MEWRNILLEQEDLQDLLDRIHQKKEALERKRPIPAVVLNRLREDLSTEWTYNSNSIEGNSLTLRETRIVLQDGLTIGGKSLREHFETINHSKAILQIESLVKPDYQLKSADILDVHAMVMKNIDEEFGGRIRNGMVRITGANFLPPASHKVSAMLDELIAWVNENPKKLPEIILASVFHHRFVWIHPFFDGNGRTVRLVMNLLLMRSGYPPAIILKNDRSKYYAALNAANKGNHQKLILLIAQAAERTLNIYHSALDDSGEPYQPISNIANDPAVPYGQEYISWLARQGKIDAYKEGRNWYTTRKAVMRHAEK